MERRSEKLKKELQNRKRKQLTSIPAKYGFKSMDAFILALSSYASSQLKTRIGQADKATGPRQTTTVRAPKTAGRSNAKYTDQHKAAVRAALDKGDKTVREIAQQTGVSEYAIIDWKQAWGLVKHRKAKGKAAKKK